MSPKKALVKLVSCSQALAVAETRDRHARSSYPPQKHPNTNPPNIWKDPNKNPPNIWKDSQQI